MADRERRGTKRPSREERLARLQKMARMGKSKGKEGTSMDPPSRGVVSPASTVRAAVTPSNREEPRPPRSGPSSPESSVHRALVTKFGNQLCVEVAESSKRSDLIEAISDFTSKLIEALCLLFSGSAAARGYANRMADKVKSAEADARSARRSEKEARAAKGTAEEARKESEGRAKATEERAKLAEEKLRFAEEWARKAEQDAEEAETSRWEMAEAMNKAERDLASAQAEHERYLEVALPAA
ncbi:hypothetical protein TIFTF001_032116 [Ficus carica]|uniref:Uncharacterized protein n=1 Tax=Ficus carica TaxID=3494 RepID=A0AA88DWK8_FICCA|nr:hypothetical protein TIFTF001_032116 [Ficus carica]